MDLYSLFMLVFIFIASVVFLCWMVSCQHDWALEEKRDIMSPLATRVIGRLYTQRCIKCGEVKTEKVFF
jgi:hypothetical protein